MIILPPSVLSESNTAQLHQESGSSQELHVTKQKNHHHRIRNIKINEQVNSHPKLGLTLTLTLLLPIAVLCSSYVHFWTRP